MIQRKGLERADAEKYYHLKIGSEFKQVVHEGRESLAADIGNSRRAGSMGQAEGATKDQSKSVEKMYEFEEFQQNTSYKAQRRKLKFKQMIKLHDLGRSAFERAEHRELYRPKRLMQKRKYDAWNDAKYDRLVSETKNIRAVGSHMTRAKNCVSISHRSLLRVNTLNHRLRNESLDDRVQNYKMLNKW